MDIKRRRILMSNSHIESIDINNYLTMKALEDEFTASFTNTIEYCVNGDGNWKTLNAGESTTPINYNETLSFRGNITPVKSEFTGSGTFSTNKSFDLLGNCGSILYGDNAADVSKIAAYAFCSLFDDAKVNHVADDFLPFTELNNHCYSHMFYSSNITHAPKLPALICAQECYSSMFRGCYYLQIAPELPATTLELRCYDAMFYMCGSLIQIPELPATTLAAGCYTGMFCDCTSLTTPMSILPALNLDKMGYCECYRAMFSGCSSLKSAPKLPATVLGTGCYSEMFTSCSSLEIAPELPATTLAANCYYEMFIGCDSLEYAPELPATTLSDNCYYQMFRSCNNLKYVKALFYTYNENNISNWLKDVASSGSFVKNRNATWTDSNNTVVPAGWTIYTSDQTNIPNSPDYDPSNPGTSSKYYTSDLNDEWTVAYYEINGMEVYQSNSNYNVNNGVATMYIDIHGYDEFTIYIRSYAESTYDYMMVSQLDQTITGSTSPTNSALVKAHTSGNQQSGTDIESHTKVTYSNIGGGSHRITIVYRKDGSVNNNDDRGYIAINYSQ